MTRIAGVPDVHIIPAYLEGDHEPTPDCFCCPLLREEDPATGRRLYEHVSKDEAN